MDPASPAREHANWVRAVDRSYGWVQTPTPTDRDRPRTASLRARAARRLARGGRSRSRRGVVEHPRPRSALGQLVDVGHDQAGAGQLAGLGVAPGHADRRHAVRGGARRRRGAGRRPSPPGPGRGSRRQPLQHRADHGRLADPARTWSAPPTSAKCSPMPTPATILPGQVLGLGGGHGQPQPGRRAAAPAAPGSPGRAGCGWPPPGRRCCGRRRWRPPSARRSGPSAGSASSNGGPTSGRSCVAARNRGPPTVGQRRGQVLGDQGGRVDEGAVQVEQDGARPGEACSLSEVYDRGPLPSVVATGLPSEVLGRVEPCWARADGPTRSASPGDRTDVEQVAHRGGAAAGGRRRGADREGRPAAGPAPPGDRPVHRARQHDPRPGSGARVVLGQEAAAPSVLTVPASADEAPSTPRRRRAVLRASLARFLTVEVPGAPVSIGLPGGRGGRRSTNHDGYVDHDVELPDVPPGWLDVRAVRRRTGPSAVARVLVVDPAARDRAGQRRRRHDPGHRADPRPGVPARHPAHRCARAHPAARGGGALPGARRARRTGPRRPVFYVSTSPWNLHEMLLQFVSMRGFPLGPLLLTDWGPSHAGLFRIGAQAHKIGLVRRMLERAPAAAAGADRRQRPGGPGDLRRRSPARPRTGWRAIYIRRTTGVDLGRNAAGRRAGRRDHRLRGADAGRRRQRADRGARRSASACSTPPAVDAVRAELS